MAQGEFGAKDRIGVIFLLNEEFKEFFDGESLKFVVLRNSGHAQTILFWTKLLFKDFRASNYFEIVN